MAKVLVPYCPAYGHIETMALAVADGARKAGGHVDVKRAPELVPEEVRGAPTSNLIRARRSLGSSTSLGHAASD